jgi:hypothetical protein
MRIAEFEIRSKADRFFVVIARRSRSNLLCPGIATPPSGARNDKRYWGLD